MGYVVGCRDDLFTIKPILTIWNFAVEIVCIVRGNRCSLMFIMTQDFNSKPKLLSTFIAAINENPKTTPVKVLWTSIFPRPQEHPEKHNYAL